MSSAEEYECGTCIDTGWPWIPGEENGCPTEADIQGAWPAEFVHEFAGGPGISSNMAREIVANRNPATVGKPKLVVSAPPPEGEGWAGMGNITQDEIISNWLVQDVHPDKNPGAAEDSIRETVARAYYLNEQFKNNPDSVSIQGVRQGIMSGRPITVMQVSDNTGILPTEEFMLYSSTGSEVGGKVQGEHHVIAGWANANSGDPEIDRAESGWFVKGAEVLNNYGVALFQHFNELLHWQEQQGHWTGDWHGVKTGVVQYYDQFGNLQGYKDSAFYDPGYNY